MTTTEPPARLAIAQAFVLHLGHLDVEQVAKLLSPTVTYRVPGSYGLAGTFHGPDEVTRHLMALAERTRGTFDAFKWEDWMVGQDYVSILADIRSTRTRRPGPCGLLIRHRSFRFAYRRASPMTATS